MGHHAADAAPGRALRPRHGASSGLTWTTTRIVVAMVRAVRRPVAPHRAVRRRRQQRGPQGRAPPPCRGRPRPRSRSRHLLPRSIRSSGHPALGMARHADRPGRTRRSSACDRRWTPTSVSGCATCCPARERRDHDATSGPAARLGPVPAAGSRATRDSLAPVPRTGSAGPCALRGATACCTSSRPGAAQSRARILVSAPKTPITATRMASHRP